MSLSSRSSRHSYGSLKLQRDTAALVLSRRDQAVRVLFLSDLDPTLTWSACGRSAWASSVRRRSSCAAD